MPIIQGLYSQAPSAATPRRRASPDPSSSTSERCFVDRFKTRAIRANITARHSQLRHLLVLPYRDSSDIVWSLDGLDVVQNSFDLRGTCARVANFTFMPVCLQYGCGFIAAGGTNAELSIRPAVAGDTWTLTTSVGASINNSIDIAPSLYHSHPLVYVSNNDRKVTISSLADPSSGTNEEQPHILVNEEELSFSTPINHSSVSPDRTKMVAVGDTPEIFLHEISSSDKKHHRIETLRAGRDAAFSTSWSRNSMQFAVASQDYMVSVWDVRKMSQRLATLGTSQQSIMGAARAVSYAHGGVYDLMAFTEQKGFVHVVDARNYESVDKLSTEAAQGRSSPFQEGYAPPSALETLNPIAPGSDLSLDEHNQAGNGPSANRPGSRRAGAMRDRAQAISRSVQPFESTDDITQTAQADPQDESMSTSMGGDLPSACPEYDGDVPRSGSPMESRTRPFSRRGIPGRNNFNGRSVDIRESDMEVEDDSEASNWAATTGRAELIEGALRSAYNPFTRRPDDPAAEEQDEPSERRRVWSGHTNTTSSAQTEGQASRRRNAGLRPLRRNTGMELLMRHLESIGDSWPSLYNYSAQSEGNSNDNGNNGYNHFREGELVGLSWGPRGETLIAGTESSLIRWQIDGTARRSFPNGSLI